MTRLLITLMLTILCVQTAFSADDSTWKLLYDEAGKLFSTKHYGEARKKAQAALAAAEKEFGPVSTRAGEVLYLMVSIEQAQGKTLNDKNVQELLGRMKFIQSKVFEEKEATFPMKWSFGEGIKELPEARHVILNFADFPNHFIGIYSKDLGEYLEKSGNNPVTVVFKVKYDKSLKLVASFNAVQIGDLTHWQSSNAYGGVNGEEQPSPWDKLVEEWKTGDSVKRTADSSGQ